MQYTVKQKEADVCVNIYGTIMASSRESFLEMLTELSTSDRQDWVIDLSDIDYLDSHGMGLMIELREKALETKAKVKIIGTNDLVYRMFTLSKFDTFFEIEKI